MPERIYLDSCVLNRPTDDQTQERIRIEAEAIARVLDGVAGGSLEWISSSIVEFELRRNPNIRKRDDSLQLLSLASTIVPPTTATHVRATALQAEGYGPFDALHLALAEEANVTTLLTVDDRFLRRASARPSGTSPAVENPVSWIGRREPWLIKR